MSKPSITAIILTHNEEMHINRCIRSVIACVSRVIVVDSGSCDSTAEIAQTAGAEVYVNPFINYATQFNWALKHCAIATDWVMRIDADEYIDETLRHALSDRAANASLETVGFVVTRYITFLGKRIRYGGVSPQHLIKIWRTGEGTVENRWMDEHVVLKRGLSEALPGAMIDDNLKNIGFWVEKHNSYATREMIDNLNAEFNFFVAEQSFSSSRQAKTKRLFKSHLYQRSPLFYRAVIYFFFRYFLLLGFLDGRSGFLFHTMQGLWYRILVDIKIYEARRLIHSEGIDSFKAAMLAKNNIAI